MKKFSLEKLNKRYNGSDWFIYRLKVEPIGRMYDTYLERTANFLKIRNWCWGTFGPSCELEMYGVAQERNLTNSKWSWRFLNYGSRASQLETFIYIASDEELALLTLKFG
jgi:hypothetical protein